MTHQWGISSDGRAPASHVGGAGIDTQILQVLLIHKYSIVYNYIVHIVYMSVLIYACL